MNSKQIKEAKRGVAIAAFAGKRVVDFTHTPPKPVDGKHAATLNKANAAIEGLGGKQAIQLAGEHGHKTEDLRGDRGDVEAMLRKINKSMASIANEKKQPGLMDRFRMPHGTSDSVLAGKLVAFANAIDELGLLDELAEHNLVLSTDALRLFAEDFKETGADQSLARGKQTGATASIPDLLKTLRECKKTWDAIYHNTYEGNTEMLTAWRSVSHVERNGGGRTGQPTSPLPVPN